MPKRSKEREDAVMRAARRPKTDVGATAYPQQVATITLSLSNGAVFSRFRVIGNAPNESEHVDNVAEFLSGAFFGTKNWKTEDAFTATDLAQEEGSLLPERVEWLRVWIRAYKPESVNDLRLIEQVSLLAGWQVTPEDVAGILEGQLDLTVDKGRILFPVGADWS